MKRFLTLIFTCALLCAALCVSAGASDFDSVAQELSTIGMFRGTASGFELDRAPKRSEAAIMLVRLYGAEEEANAQYKAGEISHPFTDVSEYTSPYVAWLYTKGITNGTSATTFSSQNTCTLQNYLVFLLRALGYQDGKDFQYADAKTFAQECGFYQPLMFGGDFLRDDLAALTEQALAANVKGADKALIAQLIEEGAIDAAAAKPLSDKISLYREIQSASPDMKEKSMDMDMDMKMIITAEGETLDSSVTGNIKVISDDPKNLQMATDMKTSIFGMELLSSTWYKDGWMYSAITTDGETERTKVQTELTAEEALAEASVGDMDVSALSMTKSISKAASGSDTVYTFVLTEGALNEIMAGELDELTGAEITIGEITASYTVNAQGRLTTISMKYDMTAHIPADPSDGTEATDASYKYDMTMKVNAVGDAVKITFPDFKDFQET